MAAVQRRGRLKIFLGYAAGVGKTYQMLTEARDLQRRGIDVVVGYFEPHGRQDTIALTSGLETVPRQINEYRGSRFEEMDTDAIIRRHPRVALVDELPHTNVPGSDRAKRWEDVHIILDAGIDVLTTMNIQHLESLSDQIWQSTGVRVRETIPDWVVKQADEVVMVDLTPTALLHRLERGVVYPPEQARAALQNFFREPTLVALRELAMRQTAHTVESRRPISESDGAAGPVTPDGKDRLLLVIGPEPAGAALIRRGRRVADYLRADCLAVYVSPTNEFEHLTLGDRDNLQRQLAFANGLHIETTILRGRDVAQTIVRFARARRVTQIFIGRQRESVWRALLAGGLVQRLVNLARDMQVTIVADRSVRRGL
jgi:two-component system sensor histidine kinase KdpD